MTKFTAEQMVKGRMRFLNDYPEIKAHIDALVQSEADALGISLESLRETETMRELRELAHAEGKDPTCLFWKYIADNEAELGESSRSLPPMRKPKNFTKEVVDIT
ncbi:hypothetical protein BN2497_5783 [Janthinobacterium sp. CG23_2]|nr:hypothetical protein BN2497_5783 [Janthinobacterium sp. CG23_2]CUU29289.1 hypothetical protein BN3177_5783 [Janthinobacterium sp. CG23_2]